jgi:hypothetical protein
MERDRREETSRQDAGRLVEEGSGLEDEEKEEVAREAPDDTEEPSSEEAAVRIDEEPEGTTGGPDRYVEGGEEAG